MKLFISLFLTLNIILIGFLGSSQNLEANASPTIQLSSTTVQQGQRARVIIQSRNLNDLAGFQIQIFYNAEVMDVAQTFTYSYTSSRGSSVINTSEDGVISISFVGTTALSGSANLFYIDFDLKMAANVQRYPLLVAVNEAINSDMNPVTLSGSRGHIDVIERTTTTRTIPISTSVNRSRMEIGETFTFSLNLNQSVLKSAGSFDIFYDDEILKVLNTTMGQLPAQSQSLTTVNDEFRGRVHFNFISLNGLNSVWPLITIEFEVIKDVQTSTNIQVIPIQVLDMDLQPLLASSSTRAVQITKKPPTFNIPSVFVESKTLTLVDDFHVDLKVENNSLLSVGVFELSYNPFLVELTEIEILNENDNSNVLTLYTHEAEEGLIRLTYINPEGLSTAQSIARLHFSPLQNENPIHTEITLEASQLLNANYQNISLGSRNAQIHLANQFNVRIYHQNQIIQEQTTDDLDGISYPFVDLEEGQRFGFWERTIQGQNITFQSRVYRLGDINDDGILNDEDLVLLRNALAGKVNLTPIQVRAAHLRDQDTIEEQSELTLKDLVLLQLRLQEQSQESNE